MRLRDLTFVGPGREPAAIRFSAGLTVVYGASDTGKSFILDAIDFMLGSSKLRKIPESEGYTDILLGIDLNDRSITLSRKMNGGVIRLFESDDPLNLGPAHTVLSPKHNKDNFENLSAFLLRETGLDSRFVRKNNRNEVASLSFRNIAHLCVVSETAMMDVIPPFLTGQWVLKTTEISTLRLVLEGEDDSALVSDGPTAETKKLSKAKYEVLQVLLADLYRELEGRPSRIETLAQGALVSEAIAVRTASIEEGLRQRSALVAQQSGLIERRRRHVWNVNRATEVLARFSLLRDQYESDLRRLDTVQEAGTLLGFFQASVCPFCGAEEGHQNPPQHVIHEVAEFRNAIEVERAKTVELLDDLLVTITDITAQQEVFTRTLVAAEAEFDSLSRKIRSAELALRPDQEELERLLAVKSEVERLIGIHAQIDRITHLAAGYVESDGPSVPELRLWPRPQVLREFSQTMATALNAWGAIDTQAVAIDIEAEDVSVNGEVRGARGKGMRSILHAAFSTSLATYCVERGLPHPGFVVLDSPLVTYRAPDIGPEDENPADELMSHEVAVALYTYLDSEFAAQSIVIENTTPPDLSDGACVVKFTKRRDAGRYGLFPPQ